jgi:Ca2+-binding RTX toxin-like protein
MSFTSRLRQLKVVLSRPAAGHAGRSRARFRPLVEQLEARNVPTLVINPTFGPTITADPNAATIEATINTAIANLENAFTDTVTVNITFNEMTTGLGKSNWFFNTVSYTSYLAALTSHATTADDTTALASLPAGPNNPVDGNSSINVQVANAVALGLASGSTTGTIGLNTGRCFLNRVAPIIGAGPYDLLATVTHEIDEVLGFASALNGLNNGAAAPTGAVWGDDLYRYVTGSTTRSFDTNVATNASFSIDGGTTDLAGFNQSSPVTVPPSSADFSDWNGQPSPKVQDAFQSQNATPNLGVELRRLDVLGYTPAAGLTAPVVKAPAAQTAVEGAPQTFNLGSFTTFAGDAGPFQVDVSWGDGSPDTVFFVASAGAIPAQSHTYFEEGPYAPKVTVTDFLSLSGSASSGVTVSDPAVLATGGLTINTVRGACLSGQTAVATFTDPGGAEPNPFDPGPIPSHYTATVDWGDSSPTSTGTITYNGTPGDDSTTNTFTVSGGPHTYTTNGTFTITVTIHHEGAVPDAVVTDTAVVVSVLNHAQGCCDPNSLVIGAALSGSSILVVPAGKQTGGLTDTVQVLIDGVPQINMATGGTTFTGFKTITIYGQTGNDNLEVAGSVKKNACIFGGGGNDRIKGGAGNNILVGGPGNDLIIGGSARDIIIGGSGNDRLVGGAGGDILIGGTTDFDDPCDPANTAALCTIRDAWASSANYSDRVAAVLALFSTNGTNAAHIHDDGGSDKLTGSSGADLFFVGLLDTITGRHPGEDCFMEGTGTPC